MGAELRELLLKCQLHLQEGDLDSLIETLDRVMELDLSGLSEEEYSEALRLVEFLIERAKEKRDEISQKLVNFQRFKGYLK